MRHARLKDELEELDHAGKRKPIAVTLRKLHFFLKRYGPM